MFGLTNKEIIELRIKCLEPFVSVASKNGIEQDIIFKKAEIAWQFAISPLVDNSAKTPRATGSGSNIPQA